MRPETAKAGYVVVEEIGLFIEEVMRAADQMSRHPAGKSMTMTDVNIPAAAFSKAPSAPSTIRCWYHSRIHT